MNTLRVAIATDDGETVARSHMGDAASFVVYDISSGGLRDRIDIRDNAVRGMGHAGSGKMAAVARILDDVDVFVAGRMSPNFKRLAARFQPVVVGAAEIDTALEWLVRSFDRLEAMVSARRRGDAPRTVLRLPDAGASMS